MKSFYYELLKKGYEAFKTTDEDIKKSQIKIRRAISGPWHLIRGEDAVLIAEGRKTLGDLFRENKILVKNIRV